MASLAEPSVSWSRLFLQALVTDMLPFAVCSGLLFLIFYVFLRRTILHRKVQSAFPVPREILREIAFSLSSIAVFAATGVVFYELYRLGWTQLYFRIDTYGWPYFFFSIFLLILIQDCWFYWTHRLLHWGPVFKWVHCVHHSFHNPTPWAAFAFHPLEAFLNVVFLPLVLLVLPVHPWAVEVWLFYMFFITAYGHLGFEVMPQGYTRHWFWGWSTTPTHHNLHHTEIRTNYGLYFTLWDGLMGTTHKKYDQKFEQITGAAKKGKKHADRSTNLFQSPWLGTVLSGILIILCFEPVGWWWCGWVVLAPIWIALRSSPEARSSPIRHGYLLGLFFVLGNFWWTGSVTLVGLAIMMLVLSFYPALWCLFVVRILRLPENGERLSLMRLLTHVCLAASFWVTLEWLRSWFMSGFNWNELGVSQVPSPQLRQLAAVGGVPLITAALVVVSLLIGEGGYSLWRRRWNTAGISLFVAALVIAMSWGYGFWRMGAFDQEVPRASISYAAIQPNVAELPYGKVSSAEIIRLEVAAFNVQQDLSARAVAGHPDLLIWPEAVTSQSLTNDSLVGQVMAHVRSIYDGEILLGAEDNEAGKVYNTAYLLDADGARQIYHKTYLVLLGEYLPWTDVFPWLRQWWGRGIPATAGTVPGHFLLRKEGLSLSPLICFEDTQPQVVRAAAATKPDFFVTLVNAGWFTGILSDWCLKQHLANAVLRCVEHDRPMIRCADTGITCEINPIGEVLAAPPSVAGIFYRQLVLYPWRPTLYDQWGDWFGLLCRWVTLVACIVYVVRERGRIMH